MTLKKKITSAALTCLLCAAMPLSVFANTTEGATEFSYVEENEPVYTVTIPAALQLEKEGSDLTITASDVAYLDGQRISVTIAGTDYYRNQMVLSGDTSKPSYSKTIRYQIIKGDQVIETTGQKDQVNGVELASFTENGTAVLTVKPVAEGNGINIEKGVTYTGTMNYGIALVANE